LPVREESFKQQHQQEQQELMWFSLCETIDLNDGQSKKFDIHGAEVALFKVDGRFYATRDFCPHLGGSLIGGQLDGTVVTCPLHYAKFDISNGNIIRGPSKNRLEIYGVKIEEGKVFVGLKQAQLLIF